MFPQREEGEGRGDGDIYGSLFGLSVASENRVHKLKDFLHMLLGNFRGHFRTPCSPPKVGSKDHSAHNIHQFFFVCWDPP